MLAFTGIVGAASANTFAALTSAPAITVIGDNDKEKTKKKDKKSCCMDKSKCTKAGGKSCCKSKATTAATPATPATPATATPSK